MKKLFLILSCAALVLPASESFAQEKTEQKTEHLDGNYVLTLTSSDKQQVGKEMSVVVATPLFQTTSSQPIVTFSGIVHQQEDGTYLVDYQLSAQLPVTTESAGLPNGTRTYTNVTYQNSSTKSTVLLHLGAPIQIIKDGEHTYLLKLDRYEAAGKAPAGSRPAEPIPASTP